MPFTISSHNDHSKGASDESILQNLRDMVERADPRESYYIEPTWRINGVPISRCPSPDPAQATGLPNPRKSTFKQHLCGLHSSELREIIMNTCLKSHDAHKDVVDMLKRMQKKKPRPISLGDRVQNPTVGLYLYCRTQRELVDIVLELSKRDETGYFKRDVKDLVMVIKEKDKSTRYA
ncbi:hypothetical protein SAMD00023353_2901430 [Rosellinia necatrix]|uniref:Uncharacterized protein n=1 Tax=Rosellinia necatrix TaxID=77044 RepID=A0A1W2TJR2_ROSNE|nr:hypothetical protein SAMD00023353_2901430 [Rosellinia necatrix]